MTVETSQAEEFYVSSLELLQGSDVAFLIGGAYAMREYADIYRDTKDLDLFCKPGDYQRLLQLLSDAGYEPEITDANWLAKARCGDSYVDIIFNSANGICTVDDSWFDHAPTVDLLGRKVQLVPAEEVLWTKLYIQDRDRFDGADALHIIRKQGDRLDWRRLMTRMELHWELLLAHLLTFRFVYPSERDSVPQWVVDELLRRIEEQRALPTPEERICRGPLLSRTQYEVDLKEWGYRWIFKHTG